MIIAFTAITLGISLIWVSAEKSEKYSVLTAQKFGLSPFFIGSTVIAFGTSAPEMLTTFFVSLEGKGTMVIGNVIGSNVANLSLVFGSMLLVVSLRKLTIKQESSIKRSTDPNYFKYFSLDNYRDKSIPYYFLYGPVYITFSCNSFWYKNGKKNETDNKLTISESNVLMKLSLSLIALVFAAWLITKGANLILEEFKLGELFIGYTVLAIGTSLPEIAASISLALKERYETVSGTLIGSNIFNGLCVLAIHKLFMNKEMSLGWSYHEWSWLMLMLFIITFVFASYIHSISKKRGKRV